MKHPHLSVHHRFIGHHKLLLEHSSATTTTFKSPFSGKSFPLLIHKSLNCRPPRLLLLYAIQNLFQRSSSPSREFDSNISYYHFRPNMLLQVNAFLCQFFWPGIDGKY